jgi:hypothetical protein
VFILGAGWYRSKNKKDIYKKIRKICAIGYEEKKSSCYMCVSGVLRAVE